MTVYLVCLDRPVGNPASRYGYAGHYAGTCRDGRLYARMREHEAGNDARLMMAAARAGIGFELVRTWPGGFAEERAVKGRPCGSRELKEKCPRCNYMPRINRWAGGKLRVLHYGKVSTMTTRTTRRGRPAADRGYAATAAMLLAEFGWTGDRRNIWNWARRRTRNLRGTEFPAGPPFDQGRVASWFRDGIPSKAEGGRRALATMTRGEHGHLISPRNNQVARGVDISERVA